MKLRAIPQIPAGLDPQLVRLIAALKENIEQLSEAVSGKTAPSDLSDGAPAWNEYGHISLDGTTPSGWGSLGSTIVAGNGGVLIVRDEGAILLCGNCVWDGATWRYKKDGPANVFKVAGTAGIVDIRVAPSGVAGAPITWVSVASVDSLGVLSTPTRPLFSGTDTAARDISSAVLTSANFWNQIDYNVGNCFNASTGRFTCPVAGYYDVSVHVGDPSADGVGANNVRIRKNGASNTGPLAELYNQVSGGTNNMVRCIIQCGVGDYIDFEAARLLKIAGVQHARFLIVFLG